MKCPGCGSPDAVQAGRSVFCGACGYGSRASPPAVAAPPKAVPKGRGDPACKRWRRAVRKRDNNRCQMPGCPGTSRVFETHHIRRWNDTPSLRYDVNNGVVLCYDCHHAIQDKEDDYIELFVGIAKKNAAADPAMTVMRARHTDAGKEESGADLPRPA